MIKIEKIILLKNKVQKKMTIEEVYKQFEKYLHKAIQSWSNKYEYDDLFQAATYGLIKTYNTYDYKKGYLFITYLALIVSNELKMYNRREKKHLQVMSLNYPMQDKEGHESEIIDFIATDEDIEKNTIKKFEIKKLNRMIKKLNARDTEILKLKFEGLTQKQIAEKFSLSQSYIARLLTNISEKLRKLYEKEGNIVLYKGKYDITKEQLLELANQYGTKTDGIKAIAKETGINFYTAKNKIYKWGIAKEVREQQETKEVEKAVPKEEHIKKEIIAKEEDKQSILQITSVKGKAMQYTIQDSYIVMDSLNNENNRVNKDQIDTLIQELTELKNLI